MSQDPSRTTETIASYLRRAANLKKRACGELGCGDPAALSPIELAQWAMNRRSEIRPATWRQYKSALIYQFEQMLNEGGAYGDIIQAIDMLKEADSSPCMRGKDAEPRTSSSKKRSITERELQAIRDYLQKHPLRWSVATIFFLQASILTGLRPIEWREARLEKTDAGRLMLIIQNAKHTNGRGNGEIRSLDISELSADQIRVVSGQLKAVEIYLVRDGLSWDCYYDGVRKTLQRVTRLLWPKREKQICLYSGRHQFSANAKKAGLSKVEVAALLGHISTLTAARHYGKKRSGSLGFAVQPSEEDVDRLHSRSPRRHSFR